MKHRVVKVLANKIVRNLSNDLLKKEFMGSDNPLAGHCYVASEAFYHTSGMDHELTPMTIKHEGATHWFLKHKNGLIIDLTAGQFKTPVPYSLARGRGFLTKTPSKRAVKLISRIKGLQ